MLYAMKFYIDSTNLRLIADHYKIVLIDFRASWSLIRRKRANGSGLIDKPVQAGS